MHGDGKDRYSDSKIFRAFVGGCALLLGLAPFQASAAATSAGAGPVTLRCSLNRGGTGEAIVQYFVVDSEQKTVSVAGELYRIGADPSGKTGRVITRWSDTEIMLVNEEWIREGWQNFRIVTVLDRLSGAIRSEDLSTFYTGHCAVADVTKKLF